MAWARIDDAFDDHEKVLTLLDHEDGAAAIGLWTLCLTWAHRNTRRKGKTPGLLPSTLPRRFLGARGRELADLLVQVRLWDEVDGGWMIHDFADYLPGKEVSEARAAAGRRGAAARWGKRQPDSNLPSGCHDGDGKTDGKPMAADGNASPSPASASSRAPQNQPANPSDGSLPSGDSKLPSDSHRSDGKPMASDGSRARARREWVDVGTTELSPIPTPIPPSAGEAAPRSGDEGTTAQTIVAEWIDRCRKRPPKQVIGQISRHIREMLAEGIDPDDIRRGLADWMTRDLHPSVLPSLVNSAMNARTSGVRPGAVAGGAYIDRSRPYSNDPKDVFG